jgi:hypothetical protein
VRCPNAIGELIKSSDELATLINDTTTAERAHARCRAVLRALPPWFHPLRDWNQPLSGEPQTDLASAWLAAVQDLASDPNASLPTGS